MIVEKIVEHFCKDNEGKFKWLEENVHGICTNNYYASKISLYFNSTALTYSSVCRPINTLSTLVLYFVRDWLDKY